MFDLIDLLCYEYVFIALLLAFILTVFVYLVVSGLFSRIVVNTSESKYGPMVIAYKTRTGAYKNAGELFTESYCLLPHREQIGIYYDDPEAVPENELRFVVGPILSNGEESPSKKEMDIMTSNGFKIFYFPKPDFVVTASFPFRTTISIFIAIFRVYPKLRQYIAERNLCAYPAIEVYVDSEIVFIMPLSRQEEFFVPEFLDEDVSVATTEVGSVAGDGAARDDDLFLKPRTPVRITHHRRSRDSVSTKGEDGSEDGREDPFQPSDEDEDVLVDSSSFDDLDDLDVKLRNQ